MRCFLLTKHFRYSCERLQLLSCVLRRLGEQNSLVKMVQGIRKHFSLGDALSRRAAATAWLQEEVKIEEPYPDRRIGPGALP